MKKILLWLASASILLIVVCIGIPLGLIINKVINVEEDCFGNRYGLMDIYIQEELEELNSRQIMASIVDIWIMSQTIW